MKSRFGMFDDQHFQWKRCGKFKKPLSSFGYFRREFFRRNCAKEDRGQAVASWNRLDLNEKTKYDEIRKNAQIRYSNSIRNRKKAHSSNRYRKKRDKTDETDEYSITKLCSDLTKTKIQTQHHKVEKFENMDADDEYETEEIDFGYFSD